MKILIIILGRIGDMILSTPMLGAIRKKYPDSKIHVLAGRANHSIIRNNPNVDNIIVFDKTPNKLIGLLLKLRKERYDYLIDPKDHYSRESNLLARMINAKTKIGFNNEGKKIYDFGIPSFIENHELHYISRCFLAIEPLGIKQESKIPKPELFPSDDSIQYVEDFLHKIGKKKNVLINLSAGSPERIWQTEKWLFVINNIDSEKFKIIISYAPGEAPQAKVMSENPTDISLFPSRNFDDVIALISRVNLIITPDTSIVHLASAFNIPIIGLFTSNEDVYKKFHPLSDIQDVIFPKTDSDDIHNIGPEKVIEAFDKICENV